MTIRALGTGLCFFVIHALSFSQETEQLSLENAVAIALERNSRVLIARQEIEAANGRVLQAGKIPNPEIGFRWNETPTSFNIGESDERDIGITQQIEFPTRRSFRIDVATHDLTIAEMRAERTRILVAADVTKAYYEARAGQEIVAGLVQQLDLLNDVQRLLSDRYRAGGGSYLDVLRGKVELARLRNDVAEARRDLQFRQARLNLLLGRSADHPFVLNESLSVGTPFVGTDSIVQILVERSFARQIAQRTLSRQEAGVGLARTGYLPDFSIGLFHQRRAEEPPFDVNQFTGTTTSALGIELGISVPLWFWQEPKGQIQEATARRTIAEMNSDHIARRVKAGILDALAAVRSAGSQIQVFDASLLNDTRDIVSTAIVRYQNDQIDIMDLLDVYRTARAMRVEYTRALLNYAVALADLEVAGELPLDDEL